MRPHPIPAVDIISVEAATSVFWSLMSCVSEGLVPILSTHPSRIRQGLLLMIHLDNNVAPQARRANSRQGTGVMGANITHHGRRAATRNSTAQSKGG